MNLPPLRVISAAWPSPLEPRRGRFLESLHLSIGDHFSSEVVSPQIYRDDPLEEYRNGISIRRFPFLSRNGPIRSAGISGIGKVTYLINQEMAVRDRWRANEFEQSRGGCVLAHWLLPGGRAAAALAKRLKVPLLLYAHGSDVNVYSKSPFGRRMIQQMLPAASKIFVASQQLVTSLISICELSRSEKNELFRVLPIGVDEVFTPSDSPPPKPIPLRVLFVGDAIASKGISPICGAVEKARSTGLAIDLRWIGTPPKSARFRNMGTVVGDLLSAEVAHEMARAHLLLLPSTHEGTPVVLQEATAMRLPWAATPVGGVVDLHDKYPGGHLLPNPDNQKAVEESIVQLMRRFVSEGQSGVENRWRLMSQSNAGELQMKSRGRLFREVIEEVLSCFS